VSTRHRETCVLERTNCQDTNKRSPPPPAPPSASSSCPNYAAEEESVSAPPRTLCDCGKPRAPPCAHATLINRVIN